MKRLQKYDLVNSCETREDIILAIKLLSKEGIIKGRARVFDSALMERNALAFFEGSASANVITRIFGIRQQAIYIKAYEKEGKDYSAIIRIQEEEEEESGDYFASIYVYNKGKNKKRESDI